MRRTAVRSGRGDEPTPPTSSAAATSRGRSPDHRTTAGEWWIRGEPCRRTYRRGVPCAYVVNVVNHERIHTRRYASYGNRTIEACGHGLEPVATEARSCSARPTRRSSISAAPAATITSWRLRVRCCPRRSLLRRSDPGSRSPEFRERYDSVAHENADHGHDEVDRVIRDHPPPEGDDGEECQAHCLGDEKGGAG